MLQRVAKVSTNVVGILFLYAAISKMFYPAEAILAISSLGAKMNTASWSITALIIVELYLGALLLLKLHLVYTIRLTASVLLIFTLFLWYLSLLANPPSCGCLGLTHIFMSARKEALFGIVRNVFLLWLLKPAYDLTKQPPEAVAFHQAESLV